LEGYNHGTAFQGKIQTTIGNFLAELDSKGYSIDELRIKAKEIENLHREVIPEKIEWMRGVADSTSIDYNNILLFNCFDKLTSPASACTAFLAQGEATKDGVTIISKNRDPGADAINCIQLHERRYPSGNTYKGKWINIPQVEETYKFIGVGSAGRWGYGQGINKFQVSIINTDVGTMKEVVCTEGTS